MTGNSIPDDSQRFCHHSDSSISTALRINLDVATVLLESISQHHDYENKSRAVEQTSSSSDRIQSFDQHNND